MHYDILKIKYSVAHLPKICTIYAHWNYIADIDFTCLNSELDFYVVKLSSSFNKCAVDNRIGGVVPIDGNADNTMVIGYDLY